MGLEEKNQIIDEINITKENIRINEIQKIETQNEMEQMKANLTTIQNFIGLLRNEDVKKYIDLHEKIDKLQQDIDEKEETLYNLNQKICKHDNIIGILERDIVFNDEDYIEGKCLDCGKNIIVLKRDVENRSIDITTDEYEETRKDYLELKNKNYTYNEILDNLNERKLIKKL